MLLFSLSRVRALQAVEDYLPHLQSIVRSLQSDDLILRTEPGTHDRPARRRNKPD